jgi:hypothetical protein
MKNPITKIQNTEDSLPKKTKKNKHETSCPDKRRRGGCGICGGNNLATDGVTYCNICGEEVYFFVEGDYFWSYFRLKEERPIGPQCNCHIEIPGWQRVRQDHHWIKMPTVYHRRDIKRIQVTYCLDCGATNGPKCPACGQSVWSKELQRYCKHCGYRS